MTNEEIVKVLRGMAMDVFRTCEGCDLEENCSVRGCAILMAATDAMENLQTENAALRRTIDNLTSAQAVVLKEFEAKLEELAEVKAERGWISVKDRLPEQTDPAKKVLFITKTDGVFIGCYYKATAYDQFNGWYSMCVRIDNVTHWMPLPEPPEKEA